MSQCPGVRPSVSAASRSRSSQSGLNIFSYHFTSITTKCSFMCFSDPALRVQGSLVCFCRCCLSILQRLCLWVGWGRKRRLSGQTCHKSKLWIATFIWFPLQTGVTCAVLITGLGSDYPLPSEEALAVLPENLALPCSAWFIFPQDSPSGEELQAGCAGRCGNSWVLHNHPGHWCTLAFSLHFFRFPRAHLGRCWFWKRIVGCVVQEQSHCLAAALKNRTEKMLLDLLASLTEVKRYCRTLALNLPASLSSFLLLEVILEQSERTKKPFKYWSLICCINLIYDEECTNLGHNQLFFSLFFS